MQNNENSRDKISRETVCINVDRVYDSCKDKDCATDLRVYVTPQTQTLLNCAVNVKPVSAEILWTYIDIEPLPFNKGFYTLDIKYFFKTYFDLYTGLIRPTRIEGLATYDKRVILFGSEGGASIYSSLYVPTKHDTDFMMRSNLPKASVEVVPPIMLSAKLVDACVPCGCCQCDVASIPEPVCACFDGPIQDTHEGNNLYTTLGIFSIVRLMREVQLLVPSYDFCIPEKECCSPTDDDPCTLFNNMDFPNDEFFPPAQRDNCSC